MVYLVEGGAEELGTQPSVWPLTPHSIWGALRGVDHHSLQPQDSGEIAAVFRRRSDSSMLRSAAGLAPARRYPCD